MEWIIGLVLMAIYVIGPIFAFGIFLLIGYFVHKTIGGIFGGGYGGGYGGGSSETGSFPSSGGNFSPGLRELKELDRMRREKSDTFQAGLKSDAANAGIFLDD